MHNFKEVLRAAKERGPITISVAAAEDDDVMTAVGSAMQAGIAQVILVGDQRKIWPRLERAGLQSVLTIIHEPDPVKASQRAVDVVRSGDANVLMKGLVNSGDFLRAVLHPDRGLRAEYRLSHVIAYEVHGEGRLCFLTDAAINIAPDLQEKKEILINALLAMHSMGIVRPNVAVISANEKVSPKMPSTVDAQNLVRMGRDGVFPESIIEGPIAFDVAVCPAAARHKGLESVISGNVDLFLMPNIETANVAFKILTHYTKAKSACLVLGATHPIVMTSRSDTAEGKLYSIALAATTLARVDVLNEAVQS